MFSFSERGKKLSNLILMKLELVQRVQICLKTFFLHCF